VPPVCKLCRHPDLETANAELLRGESFRNIAKRFGTSAAAAFRHKREHLPGAIVRAKAEREETHGDELAEQLSAIRKAAWDAKAAAEKDGDTRTVLAALKVLLEHADLATRVAERRSVSIPLTEHPEYLQLKKILGIALRPLEGETCTCVTRVVKALQELA
jgi:hypothetical protein